jgi:hypothetical protein
MEATFKLSDVLTIVAMIGAVIWQYMGPISKLKERVATLEAEQKSMHSRIPANMGERLAAIETKLDWIVKHESKHTDE